MKINMNLIEFATGIFLGIVITKIMPKRKSIKSTASPLLPLNMRHSVPGDNPISIANHARVIVENSKSAPDAIKFVLHMGLSSTTDGIARAALLVATANWLRCDMYYKGTRQALQDSISFAETRNSEITSYMSGKLMETEDPLEKKIIAECTTFMQEGLCNFLALEEEAVKKE